MQGSDVSLSAYTFVVAGKMERYIYIGVRVSPNGSLFFLRANLWGVGLGRLFPSVRPSVRPCRHQLDHGVVISGVGDRQSCTMTAFLPYNVKIKIQHLTLWPNG